MMALANPRQRGMTLIELLVALAIFAVMSAAVFFAFNSFQRTKEITERGAERLKNYQMAFNIIARDIQQMAPRPVKDEFGSPMLLPALKVNADPSIEFTRAGWNRSPFSRAIRSELQRVSYYVEDQNLMRASWTMLDRATESLPARAILLEGIESIRVEMGYRGPDDGWRLTDMWPPEEMMAGQGGSGAATTEPTVTPYIDEVTLPRVISITFDTFDYGKLERKFLIADGYADIFYPKTINTTSSGSQQDSSE